MDAAAIASFHPHDDVPWRPAPGYAHPGAEEKILFSHGSGAYTRLVRWPPGFLTGTEPLSHPDVDEFAWVVSGTSISVSTGTEAKAGAFCTVPAGVDHGPFSTPDGVVLLETRIPVSPGAESAATSS